MEELASHGNGGFLVRLAGGVSRVWGWLCCKLTFHRLERPKDWNTDRQFPYTLCRCTRCHGTDWRYNLDPALRKTVEDDEGDD
jgi:hypothetical protein